MGGFTREEVAQRAGIPVDSVDRLVELAILTPDESALPFTRGDVRRARFVHGLEQGGIPLEVVGSAVQSGELSFAFFDTSFWDRFGGLAAKTYRELSAETGLSLDLLQAIRESMGFARPGPDDRVREDEFDPVALVRTLIAAGVDPVAKSRAFGGTFSHETKLNMIASTDAAIWAPVVALGVSIRTTAGLLARDRVSGRSHRRAAKLDAYESGCLSFDFGKAFQPTP